MIPLNSLKPLILIILGAFWLHQTLLDMLSTIVSNSNFLETVCSRRNDYFCVPCWHPKCKSLLMKFSLLGRMAISIAEFWSFIIELVTRNPTMGIPALEDALFVNVLIFDVLCLQNPCFLRDHAICGYRMLSLETHGVTGRGQTGSGWPCQRRQGRVRLVN